MGLSEQLAMNAETLVAPLPEATIRTLRRACDEELSRRTSDCPLSKREVDALRGLAAGKVYREIAEEMGLSASTVRTHLHNIYRKTGAADRAHVVMLAVQLGWVPAPELGASAGREDR